MTIELVHSRRGSGEPLVLLHGIGHRHEAFAPIFDRLAEHFDVIAVDMPGFGRSPELPPGTRYSIESLAAAIVENFDLWGIERPHVVGNSLGGAVSIVLGQRGHARSVTGLSPAGWFRPWSLLQAGLPLMILKVGAYAPPAVLKAFTKTALGRWIIGFTMYQHPERVDTEAYHGDSLAMRGARAFWPMFLSSISFGLGTPKILTGAARVPTTIAWGDGDRLLAPSQATHAARTLSGVEFVILPDSGHVPMVDNPDAVIVAIEDTAARASASETPIFRAASA